MSTPADNLPVYTSAHPPVPDSNELRARIPGWGADLELDDRPSVPKLRHDIDSGAHWNIPERQAELAQRERSIEHRILTPVFGTAQPLRGVPGAIRRLAYRFSEGRAAHWLILLLADRVEVTQHRAMGILTLKPDNWLGETGIRAELTRGGLRSRFGKRRSDVKHMWMDPLVGAAPWVVLAGVVLRWRAKRRR
jgi:hypothetical protein